MSEKQGNFREKSRISGELVSITDARWVDPANTNAQAYKPDREKLNPEAQQRYDRLVDMGYENKLSMTTSPRGSNLTLNIETKAFRRDGRGTYTNFMTVEDAGNRNSVLSFVERFDEALKKGETPTFHASGYQGASSGNNRGRFYVHFSETEEESKRAREEYKQKNPGAFAKKSGEGKANTARSAAPANHSLDDEIPF